MTKHFRLWRRNLKSVVRDVTWNVFQEYFEAVGQIEYTLRRRREAKQYKSFDAIMTAYRNPYDMQFKHNVMLNNWFAYPTHEVSPGTAEDGDVDASALGPQGEKELLLFATGASEAALDRAITRAAWQDNIRRSLLVGEKAEKPSVLGTDKVSLVRHITELVKFRRPKGPDLYPTSADAAAGTATDELMPANGGGDFGPYNGPPVKIFGRLADLEPAEFGDAIVADYSSADPNIDHSGLRDKSQGTPAPNDYSYGHHDYSRWTATGDPYPADHSTGPAERSGSNVDHFTPRSTAHGAEGGGSSTLSKSAAGLDSGGGGGGGAKKGIAEDAGGGLTHTSIADAVKAAAAAGDSGAKSGAAAPAAAATAATATDTADAAPSPNAASAAAVNADEDAEFQKLLQSVQDVDDT